MKYHSDRMAVRAEQKRRKRVTIFSGHAREKMKKGVGVDNSLDKRFQSNGYRSEFNLASRSSRKGGRRKRSRDAMDVFLEAHDTI